MPQSSIFDFFTNQANSAHRGDPRSQNLDAILRLGTQGAPTSSIANALVFGSRSGLNDADGARVATNAALGLGLQEAGRIRDVEDQRFAEQSQFLGQEFQNANAPTITNETIDTMHTMEADQIGQQTNDALMALREQLGEAGIQGGAAAGYQADLTAERLASLSQVRGNLKVFKANADAQDRINRFNRAFGLAQFRNQSPSATFMDALGSAASFFGGRENTELNLAEASKARKHQIFGGLIGGVGQLFGAGLGAM